MLEKDAKTHKPNIDNYLKTGKSTVVGIGRTIIAKHKNGSPIKVHLYIGELKEKETHLFICVIHGLGDEQ